MEHYVTNTWFPGMDTMLYRNDELVHHSAYGLLGSDPKIPMPLDGIFRIFSMTKPVICTALMMLYEQGKCQLFDPVSWYIPGFRNLKVYTGNIANRLNQVSKRTAFRASDLVEPIREVTIHDLLTHTSGITYEWMEHGGVDAMYLKSDLTHTIPLEQFVDDLLEFAQSERIDMTVVGPEGPLVEGIVDLFSDAGLACLGPRQDAAQLEGSKSFAKAFLQRHGIPTAGHRVFADAGEALGWLDHAELPVVLKAVTLSPFNCRVFPNLF